MFVNKLQDYGKKRELFYIRQLVRLSTHISMISQTHFYKRFNTFING